MRLRRTWTGCEDADLARLAIYFINPRLTGDGAGVASFAMQAMVLWRDDSRKMSNLMKCQRCNHPLRTEANFCAQCGTPSGQRLIQSLFDAVVRGDSIVFPIGLPKLLEENRSVAQS